MPDGCPWHRGRGRERIHRVGAEVSRAVGTRRVYRLDPEGVAGMRAWLDRVWDDALAAFQKAAEATPDHPEEENPR